MEGTLSRLICRFCFKFAYKMSQIRTCFSLNTFINWIKKLFFNFQFKNLIFYWFNSVRDHWPLYIEHCKIKKNCIFNRTQIRQQVLGFWTPVCCNLCWFHVWIQYSIFEFKFIFIYLKGWLNLRSDKNKFYLA